MVCLQTRVCCQFEFFGRMGRARLANNKGGHRKKTEKNPFKFTQPFFIKLKLEEQVNLCRRVAAFINNIIIKYSGAVEIFLGTIGTQKNIQIRDVLES